MATAQATKLQVTFECPETKEPVVAAFEFSDIDFEYDEERTSDYGDGYDWSDRVSDAEAKVKVCPTCGQAHWVKLKPE